MGRVVTIDGVVATIDDVVVQDDNGTACCDLCGGTVDCCDTCRKLEGLAGNCDDKPCCMTAGRFATSDGDIVIGGHWAVRLDEGPNFWIIDVTQTSVATWNFGTIPFWDFTATVRQRCKVNNTVSDVTISEGITLFPGFSLRNYGGNLLCRQLFIPEGLTLTGCFFDRLNFAMPLIEDVTDPENENFDCFGDSRFGRFTDSRGTWTYIAQYTVDKCAQRCVNDCVDCR